MRLLLLLLSSQISAELMSLKCEWEYPLNGNILIASKIFTFDKNQGETADVERFGSDGKLMRTTVGAKVSWSPSSIIIAYSRDGVGGSTYYKDVISRADLSYQSSNTWSGLTSNWDGQCKIVDVEVEKVF